MPVERDRGECRIGQQVLDQRTIRRPMLEPFRLVADDRVFDAMLVHPGAEQRHIGLGLRALAAGVGHQHDVGGLAACRQFYDHRGRIDAGAPGGNDGLTPRHHRASQGTASHSPLSGSGRDAFSSSVKVS